ncbi:MAG: thiopeptide-type bacteriocin biosynthesis protein [Bacteroidota bacterium]
MKRKFIVGSEWLYYKIYCGAKTSDRILCELIKPVVEDLLSEKIIDSWFFIRYADPKLHIRVRFHHLSPFKIEITMKKLCDKLESYIDSGLIWDLSIGVYNRELERYGQSLIEKTEQSIFYYDSMMIVNILDLIEGDEGEVIRWKIGLRAINDLLDLFEYDEENKLKYIKKIRDGFGLEFGMDKNLKSQLSEKYRSEKKEIEFVMDSMNDTDSDIAPLFDILLERKKNLFLFAKEMKVLEKKNQIEIPIDQLLSSYLHMMCNRLFKSNQRLHELVLYDFLCQYYTSLFARKRKSAK